METIRLNPLPAALIGIGVGWLLMSMREQDSVGTRYARRTSDRNLLPDDEYGDVDDEFSTRTYSGYGEYAGYSGAGARTAGFTATGGAATERVKSALLDAGDKASDLASDTKAKVGDAVDTARDKVADVVGTAREKASDLTDAAREKASDLAQGASQLAASTREKASDLASEAKERVSGVAVEAKAKSQEAVGSVDTFIHENPLAAGAIALGVGIVVGLLLPTTRKESELLGPTRDRLVDQAKDAAGDLAQKAQKVAEAALGTAKESLTEVREAVEHSLDDAKTAVKQGLDDAKVAVKDTVQTEAQNQGLTGQSQSA